MAECKDCIHYSRCNEIYEAAGFFFDYEKSCCKQFSKRSEWVHLPCNVGDTVYCFAPCFEEMHHAKLKVVESEIVEMRTIATVLGLNFDVDRIGKTVFLTREEAEKALKERSEK